ncbi:MAG: LysM peptidoglycan-binding domain-containing protein [Saprospiraceae bacterium]|nr:LysM peptidoglycan-binding domain-containing protein [Saprospiraceae bacterium]
MNMILTALIRFTLGSLLLTPVSTPSEQVHEEYIRTYREIAIKEMERTGIPASIKLAQAILESNGGRSELARKAHNHFGIKCGNDWKGDTYHLEDDDYDSSGNKVHSCFRVYRRDEASFIAHSEFLRDPKKAPRYGFLFRIPPTDYRRWAHGLRKAGYASNPRYPQLLIDMIERYKLDQYDLISPDALDKLAGISRINDIRLTFAKDGESLASIAKRTETPVSQLIKYNDYLYKDDGPLPEEALVYLQPKRNYFRGKQQWHKVQTGETLMTISQLYGIKVDKLRKKNRIPDGFEPAVGERIRLRWKVSKKDIPRIVRPGPRPEKGTPLPVQETTPSPTATTPNPQVIDDSDPPLDASSPKPKAPKIPSKEDEPGPSTLPVLHTVEPGDTLWQISRKYKISVEQIKSFNQLQADSIQVGQKLRVK